MNLKLKKTCLPLMFLFLGLLYFIVVPTIPLPFITAINHKLIMGIISCLCLYALSKVFMYFDNTSMNEMNLKPKISTLNYVVFGLVIGTIITGTMLLVLFSLTNIDIQIIEKQSIFAFILSAFVFIPLALMEEILFRGYPFFRLAQLINIRWVITITASLFALYHYNASSGIVGLLIGPGIWGVTYGVAAYLSNSVAVPLGIHVSANFMQAMFGLKAEYPSLWKVVETTNSTIIEANSLGLIMQFILLFGSLLILELSIKRKKNLLLKITNSQAQKISNNKFGSQEC